MKQLHGTAATEVAAPAEQCFALLEDVERYPTWYPEVVRRVAVTERSPEGRAVRAQALLHVSYGPLVRDFDLMLAVESEPPTAVTLRRVAHGSSDDEEFRVSWTVREGPRTRIELSLDANLSVPRLLPVGGIGEGLAHGFVGAAANAL